MGIVVFVLLLIDFSLHIFFKKFKVLTKCLLMPLLIAFYLVQAAPIDPLVVSALLMGLIGDFFLTRPERPAFFELGLVSFLAGHLLYAFIFLKSTGYLQTVPAWFYSLALFYLGITLLLLSLLKNGLKEFKIPFLVYCGGISLMSMLALARVFSMPAVAFLLPFAGSLLFITSDSILAYGQFRAKIKNSDLLVMATYVAAQVLIICGLLTGM